MRNPFRLARAATPNPAASASPAAKPPAEGRATGFGFDFVESVTRGMHETEIAYYRARAENSRHASDGKDARTKLRSMASTADDVGWDEASLRAEHAVLARKADAALAAAAGFEAAREGLEVQVSADAERRAAASRRGAGARATFDIRHPRCEALLAALKEHAPDHPLLAAMNVGYADGSPRRGVDAVFDDAFDAAAALHGLPPERDRLAVEPDAGPERHAA